MDDATQTKLAELADTKMTLADWRLALGSAFEVVHPKLTICIGEVAGSYPDPQTGLRLQVHRRGERFAGFPVGDGDRDTEDIELTPEDVALWRLPETATASVPHSFVPMEDIWQPLQFLWNGNAFQIEEPITCFNGYDLENNSIEDYFPDLRDDWSLYNDLPQDEIKNLRILRYVGYEKTLMVHIMINRIQNILPDRLESSGDTLGWHAGGAVVVNGVTAKIKGVRVEETELNIRAQIDAVRRARSALPTSQGQLFDKHYPKQVKIRTFEIWEGCLDAKGEVELAYGGCDDAKDEYKGVYFEDYETDGTGAKTAAPHQKNEFRIGHIYDAVKGKILVFRQKITSREEEVASGLTHGDDPFRYIIDAWNGSGTKCRIDDYNVRDPIPADMQRISELRHTTTRSRVEPDTQDKKGVEIHEEIRKNINLIPDLLKKVENIPLHTAALLKGTIRQKLGTLGTVVEDGFAASAHFKNITWQNNQYVLRQKAAVIIETLYIAQKSFGLPGMNQEEVFAQIYGSNKKDWPSSKTRIQNYFRKGGAKRLWDDGCIGHDGKGNFHLNLKIHT